MNISTEMSEFFPYCSHLIDLKCVLIYDLKSDSNFLLCNMASCKGIQDNFGIWIPLRGFRIRGTGF